MQSSYLLVLFILFIITIGYSKQQNATESFSYIQDNQIVHDKRYQISDENFQTFINMFFSDSTFQKSRIRFPLQIFDLDRKKLWAVILNEPADTLKIVYSYEWEYISSVATDTLHYEIKVKYVDDLVLYVERGIDFGLSTIYQFKNINMKWFLVRLEFINI